MLPLLPLLGVGLKVAAGAGLKVAVGAIGVKVASNVIGLVTMHYITDYVKNKNKYKRAIKYRIEEILKSGNYNTINIGIYDDNSVLLGNEVITCESVDNNLKVGQEIYI